MAQQGSNTASKRGTENPGGKPLAKMKGIKGDIPLPPGITNTWVWRSIVLAQVIFLKKMCLINYSLPQIKQKAMKSYNTPLQHLTLKEPLTLVPVSLLATLRCSGSAL